VIQVINGPQFAADIERRLRQLSRDLDVCAKRTAFKTKAMAEYNTPVRTSRLVKGWRGPTPVGKWTYEVSNDVPYGIYVEFGHRVRMGKKGATSGESGYVMGRFMLTKAVRANEPNFLIQCDNAVKKACS
jgi:hypothetical protein